LASQHSFSLARICDTHSYSMDCKLGMK
jgi:hypothetical protein